MRNALHFEPSLKPQARTLVDHALIHQRVEGDDLEDLFLLRLNHVDHVYEWAYHLIEEAPISQRVQLAYRMGTCAEFQLEQLEPAFIFYMIGLNQCVEGHQMQSLMIEGLMRLALFGLEEGDTRLLAQLKEMELYEELEHYLLLKSQHTDNPKERAEALNTCAYFAGVFRLDLQVACERFQEAIMYYPAAVDLRQVIRVAREIEDWEALDHLLSMQLSHTTSVKKKQALLRAQAQSRYARKLYVPAYLALLGVLSLGDSAEIQEDIKRLLSQKEATSIIEEWLLREEASEEYIGWTQEILTYYTQIKSEEEHGTQFLSKALARSSHNWEIAQVLLQSLEERARWEDWLQWVVTTPKNRWPHIERGQLIARAITQSRTSAPHYTSSLLKAYAESLDEIESDPKDCLQAWSAYLDERPGDRKALAVLDQIARKEEAWEILVHRYEAALEVRQTGKIHLLETLAELYAQSLGDEINAEVCWRKVLEVKKNHERAGEWLTLTFIRRQKWAQILEICEIWTPSDSFPLWIEGQLRAHLELKNLEPAFALWEQLTQERTQHLFVPSLLALAVEMEHGPFILKFLMLEEEQESYKNKGDEEESLDEESLDEESLDEESLGEERLGTERLGTERLGTERLGTERLGRVKRQEDVDRKRDHLNRLKLRARALTYLCPTLDEFQAIQAWRRVLSQSSADVDALFSLTELYGELGMYYEILEMVEIAEPRCDKDDRYRRVITQAALRLESRFEDYIEAIRCWITLYTKVDHWRDQALSAIHRIVKKSGLWDHLNEIWEKENQRVDEKNQLQIYKILLAKTQLYAGPLNQWQKAYNLLFKLEELNPYDAEVKGIYEYLSPALGAWELTADRWRVWAERAPIGPVRAHWLSRIAELYETRLERPEDARHLYQMALEMSSDDVELERIQDLKRLDARLLYNTTPD